MRNVLKLRPRPALKPTVRQRAGAWMGRFMQLPEASFGSLVRDFESGSLFIMLQAHHVLRKKTLRAYPAFAAPAGRSVPQAVGAVTTEDVESLLSHFPGVDTILQALGPDRTRQLLRDCVAVGPLCEELGLSRPQQAGLTAFLEAFRLRSEIMRQVQPGVPSGSIPPDPQDPEQCIGEIVPHAGGWGPVLQPQYQRRSYELDARRLRRYSRTLSVESRRQLRIFLRTLGAINARRSTMFAVVDLICRTQAEFFRSRGAVALRPLSQQQIARDARVHKSTVSRAIQGKTLEMPWGRRVSVSAFFPPSRRVAAAQLRQLIGQLIQAEDPGVPYADEQLRRQLRILFDLRVSRETVTKCRRSAGIGSSRQRRTRKAVNRDRRGES